MIVRGNFDSTPGNEKPTRTETDISATVEIIMRELLQESIESESPENAISASYDGHRRQMRPKESFMISNPAGSFSTSHGSRHLPRNRPRAAILFATLERCPEVGGELESGKHNTEFHPSQRLIISMFPRHSG